MRANACRFAPRQPQGPWRVHPDVLLVLQPIDKVGALYFACSRNQVNLLRLSRQLRLVDCRPWGMP